MKLLVSLSAEPRNQVSRERETGNEGLHLANEFEVCLARVIPSHLHQHLCVSALRGKMDELADVVVLGYSVKQLIRKVFGVRRGESEPNIGEFQRSLLQ